MTCNLKPLFFQHMSGCKSRFQLGWMESSVLFRFQCFEVYMHCIYYTGEGELSRRRGRVCCYHTGPTAKPVAFVLMIIHDAVASGV